MRSPTLKIVLNPINLGWNLRSAHSSNAKVGVIGWTIPQPGIDAGVPPAITNLISNALCRVGQVSFLDPESPVTFSPSSLGRLKGRPRFAITTTSQPEIASRLFTIDEFPWEQRSQVVILHAVDTIPAFDYPKLFTLWSESSPDLNILADAMQASGYLFPGIDGDFAEIVMFDDSLWNQFSGYLHDECRQANILIQEISSDSFHNTDWTENS